MNVPAQTREQSGTTDACRVVILYDGPEARSKAMEVCNHLVLQFEGDLAFDFNWWRMDFLKEAGLADLSAEEAGLADILIICANPAGRLALHVKKWFGSWARKHSEHLGIMVDLTKASAEGWNEIRATKRFLREAARQAGFDYLETSCVPLESFIKPLEPGRESAATPFPVPEYLPSEQPPAPEHSGLNE